MPPGLVTGTRPGGGLIASILPAGAVAAESAGPLPRAGPGLFPAEQLVVRTAGPHRRVEFTAGRRCARAALAGLGLAAVPIPQGPAGEPQWPAGVTGSITHCPGYRACAVARTADLAGLGIDAEPDEALPDGLIQAVATGAERAASTARRPPRPRCTETGWCSVPRRPRPSAGTR